VQLACVLAALLAISAVVARGHGGHHSGTAAGRFDYYLM
jgi:hypothetical protein